MNLLYKLYDFLGNYFFFELINFKFSLISKNGFSKNTIQDK